MTDLTDIPRRAFRLMGRRAFMAAHWLQRAVAACLPELWRLQPRSMRSGACCYLSSERAFARLTAPGGFWDEQVASSAFEPCSARAAIAGPHPHLVPVQGRLEHAFADIAIEDAASAPRRSWPMPCG